MVRQSTQWMVLAVGFVVIPQMVAKRVVNQAMMNASMNESLVEIEQHGAVIADKTLSHAEGEEGAGTGGVPTPQDIRVILQRSRPLYSPKKQANFFRLELSSREKTVGFFVMGCQQYGKDCYQGEWYQQLNKGGAFDVLGLWPSAYTLNFVVEGSFLMEFDDNGNTFRSGFGFLAEAIMNGKHVAPRKYQQAPSKSVLRMLVQQWLQSVTPGVTVTVTLSEGPSIYKLNHFKGIVFNYKFFIPDGHHDTPSASPYSGRFQFHHDAIKEMMRTLSGGNIESVVLPMIEEATGARDVTVWDGAQVGTVIGKEPAVKGSLISHSTLDRVQQEWIKEVRTRQGGNRMIPSDTVVKSMDLEIILQEVQGVWMATQANFNFHEGGDVGKAISGAFAAIGIGKSQESAPTVVTFVMDQADMMEAVAKARPAAPAALAAGQQQGQPGQRTAPAGPSRAGGLTKGMAVKSNCRENGTQGDKCPVNNLKGTVEKITPDGKVVINRAPPHDGKSTFYPGDLEIIRKDW